MIRPGTRRVAPPAPHPMVGPLLEVHTRPEASTAPVADARTIVESGDGRRRLGAGLVGLVILGLTLGATAHVAVHAKRIEVAIALGKEERAFRELTEQRRNLEIEIGMLKDPARIISIARDKLGMRPPAPEDIHPLVRPAERSAR